MTDTTPLRVRTGGVEGPRPRLQIIRPHQPVVDPAVLVEDVSLHYPLGAQRRGSIKASIFRLFGYREPMADLGFVSALEGVSLRIGRGERVAIIGQNGSGKSTLLRAIAGIYPPKSGSIRVAGSIGTLLDISLGFETESSGRENIYNRGLTLGLTPSQIAEAEEDIVAFAGLGDFIDLPMRTYSTGMFVRLGFAISTQYAPDVLLVDEVFGAGDAVFAAKARRRMQDIVESSGIMILVTHDLSAAIEHCDRVVWLNRGKIVDDGPPRAVVDSYIRTCS